MKILEKTLYDQYNQCLKHGLYISWLTFLRSRYEEASHRKQYQRAHDINTLIIEDINGDHYEQSESAQCSDADSGL